ncbi:MAG: hypothetical protein ACRDQ0_23590, partial [Pseudonocardia sp.]
MIGPDVCGADVLGAVQSLVDQSLLTVREVDTGVRFRMLETVREFGRMQLVEAGEDAAAQAAHRRWATRYADAALAGLHGPDQVRCMGLLHIEEANLADALRRALAEPDPPGVVVLLAALSTYWLISDDHIRVVVLAPAVRDALRDWQPPPELADHTRVALAEAVHNAAVLGQFGLEVVDLREELRRLGPGPAGTVVAANATVVLAIDVADPGGTEARLRELSDGPDARVAMRAMLWRIHEQENAGNPEAAIALATRALALVRDDDGPWSRAMLHAQLAQLHAGLGRHDVAVEHAWLALPVFEQLGASDDTVHLYAEIAIHALVHGRFDEAERIFATIDLGVRQRPGVDVRTMRTIGRAELAVARGQVADALRLYREAVAQAREVRIPGFPEARGFEPWTLSVEAMCVVAFAVYGGDREDDAELVAQLRHKARRFTEPDDAFLDFPILGLMCFAFGMWCLRRGEPGAEPDAAVRLLALADRFAYSRWVPALD